MSACNDGIRLFLGGCIIILWGAMAWCAFHAHWAHLFGWFILQTGIGLTRDGLNGLE